MTFDVIVVLLAVLSFIRGWQKGLLWAIGSLIAVLVAILFSLKASHILANFLIEEKVLNNSYTVLISFILLFILTVFCFRQLSKFVETVLDKLFLGWVNKLLGGLFYVFISALVLSLCCWLLNKTTMLNASIKNQSKTYSYLEPIAPKVLELSSEYVPLCKNLFEQINTTLSKAVEGIKQH